MTHEILDDVYTIRDDEGEIILSISLTSEPGNQIVIRTKKEVYAGPVDLISFNENPSKYE